MISSKASLLSEKIAAQLAGDDLENLSTLELDLLMQRVRDLYEELEAAKTGTISQIRPEISRTVLTVEQTPKEEDTAEDISQAEPVQMRPLKKPVQEFLISTGSEFERKPQSGSLNESVTHGASLNEKLKPTLTEVHQKFAVRPLKDMIDLNKKYVLVNELFGGDPVAYVTAVKEIDTSGDYAAALSYMQTQLAPTFKWDESAQSVRLFSKLVRQKFGVE